MQRPPFRRVSGAFVVVAATAAVSCQPDLGEDPSLVTEPRVVAVVADPPEVAPGVSPGNVATYRVVVATPSGPVEATGATWAFCAVPKPVTENGTTNASCLTDDPASLRNAGAAGPTTTVAVPDDACRLFGPDPPSGGFRPRDPDATGGYYQPLRVVWNGVPVVALQRILCNLAQAPAAAALDYRRLYVTNKNPALEGVTAQVNGEPRGLGDLPAGTDITLEAHWPPGTAEEYLTFDVGRQVLVTRRESLRVSWFVTGGSLTESRTGAGETDPSTVSRNVWRAPPAGSHHLYVVIRDARGGVATAHHVLVTR